MRLLLVGDMSLSSEEMQVLHGHQITQMMHLDVLRKKQLEPLTFDCDEFDAAVVMSPRLTPRNGLLRIGDKYSMLMAQELQWLGATTILVLLEAGGKESATLPEIHTVGVPCRSETCNVCSGKGTLQDDDVGAYPCYTCEGKGMVKVDGIDWAKVLETLESLIPV